MASGFSDYDKYDSLGLAEPVRKKEVKPGELVEEAISRIESLNPRRASDFSKSLWHSAWLDRWGSFSRSTMSC